MDAEVAVQILKKEFVSPWIIANLVQDIFYLMNTFTDVMVSHVFTDIF